MALCVFDQLKDGSMLDGTDVRIHRPQVAAQNKDQSPDPMQVL